MTHGADARVSSSRARSPSQPPFSRPDQANPAAEPGRLENLGSNLSAAADYWPPPPDQNTYDDVWEAVDRSRSEPVIVRLDDSYGVEKYRLRRIAAKALHYEAVAGCGRRASRNFKTNEDRDVLIKINDGRASFSGVITCGSVWLCPVCAAKIAARRRREVVQAVAAHAEAGGFVYMATFTLPHWQFDKLAILRSACSGAWTKVINGRPWTRAAAAAGLVGNIRALEVTENHGAGGNGWHPHLHVLVFLDRLDDADAFGKFLFLRWRDRIVKAGCRRPSWQAWDWHLCRKPTDAADYIAKGADWEITHGHAKRAKGAGRSTRQILESLAVEWNDRDVALLREFAAATKGARQLTWSNGLKKRFRVDEVSDADAASAEQGTTVAELDPNVYARLYELGREQALLRAAENGGIAEMMLFLQGLGLSHGLDPPGWDRGRNRDYTFA